LRVEILLLEDSPTDPNKYAGHLIVDGVPTTIDIPRNLTGGQFIVWCRDNLTEVPLPQGWDRVTNITV
jgi:hypothetical protein